MPELWGEIRSGKRDAVWLHGYGYAADTQAFLAAKSQRLPVYMRNESTCYWPGLGGKENFATELVDRLLAIGTANTPITPRCALLKSSVHWTRKQINTMH